jgi:hypothetical protein
MEQIIALKPEAVTPTTCSTDVLASDINHDTSSPDSTVPTKCSLFCTVSMTMSVPAGVSKFPSSSPDGLVPANVGEETDADQQLTDSADNFASRTDGAVPAMCTTPGFSCDVGGVEVMFSSLQRRIMFMASSVPLGASSPPALHQFGPIKPDMPMPITCSTGLFAISIDSMHG